MGPPPRSLAAEAHGCFMVRVPCRSHRIQGRGAMLRATWAGSPRFDLDQAAVLNQAPPIRSRGRTHRHGAAAQGAVRVSRACPGGSTGTSRALLRQTRGGRCAARGSLLWTTWTNPPARRWPQPLSPGPPSLNLTSKAPYKAQGEILMLSLSKHECGSPRRLSRAPRPRAPSPPRPAGCPGRGRCRPRRDAFRPDGRSGWSRDSRCCPRPRWRPSARRGRHRR